MTPIGVITMPECRSCGLEAGHTAPYCDGCAMLHLDTKPILLLLQTASEAVAEAWERLDKLDQQAHGEFTEQVEQIARLELSCQAMRRDLNSAVEDRR